MSDVLAVIIIPLVIIISLMMFMMRRGWIPSLFESNLPDDENNPEKYKSRPSEISSTVE